MTHQLLLIQKITVCQISKKTTSAKSLKQLICSQTKLEMKVNAILQWTATLV